MHEVRGHSGTQRLGLGSEVMKLMKSRHIFSSILVMLLSVGLWATDQSTESNLPSQPGQVQADQDNQPDPPGRVARLQYMTGQISVQPGGTGDWIQGEGNRPLTNADNVWADKSSRAELSLGTGLMRIDSESSLTLTNIGTDAVQVSLHQGTLNVHVRRLEGGEVWEVDTPNIAFTLAKAGDYRFDVDPNNDKTVVTVWKGEGDATGQGSAVVIHSGEQDEFSGGTSLAHETRNAPSPDGFDDWCRVRDRQADESVSAKYVAPGTVGYEDLDQYGSWKQSPDYGPVWVPTDVSPGWAPYSYGNWSYIGPWGWTWIDAYPWGFAPFHYGRWVSWGGGWGWAPGPYWARPWYSPALVAWWGGPGWGVGFGFGFGGGFGWCPLGWGEPFFPWYHVSHGYFRNVNITNTRITNINHFSNAYFGNRHNVAGLYGRNGIANPRFMNRPGAVTAMSRSNFERGMAVRGNSVKVSANDLRGASSLGRLNATPTRSASLGPKAGMPAARPQNSSFSRPTVSHMTPPAGSRGVTGSARSPSAPAVRGENSMARGTEGRGNSMSSIAPGGHYVPRPPQSMTSRSYGERAGTSVGRSENTQMAFNHNVPRPPSSFNSRGGVESREPSFGGSSRGALGSSSMGRPSGNSVPRPTGRVMPAPRGSMSATNRGYSGSSSYGGYRSYSSPRNSGSYSSPRYNGSPYSGRGYSPSRSYSGSSYGGSYSAHNSMPSRSYGGSSYGGGHYSAPSYGGGGHYSAPSYGGGSSHSYGGGGFHGYSGGGGSHISSGGGFHGGGGGSHGGGHR